MNTKRFGIIGEKIAQWYLKNKGYEIIKTNYYTKKGEIDIIAQKNKCIIFVEVKTRTNSKFGTPGMAIDFIKKENIKKAAKIFIHTNNLYEKEIRFDAIEIYINSGKCKINHIECII